MQDSRVDTAQFYTEFSGLNALKTQARTDKRAALEQVAKQFESLFMSQMLKSMRSVNDVFAEGNYLNSSQSKFYQEMFDNQLTLSMSQNQGLGLSDVLARQLARQIPGMDNEGERAAGHRASITDYERSLPPLSPRLPAQVNEVKAISEDVAVKEPVADETATEELPESFESPEHFVETLLPMAEAVAGDSGIDPRVMVAQAALETGWGKHMIKGGNGEHSFNLFGIKADSRWQGGSVDILTSEYREGIKMNERAAFRAYPDYQASFEDYIGFLERNPRYRDVLAVADDPEAFADGLQAAGYATDPAYGAKIRRILNSDSFEAITGQSLSLNQGGEE
ncbi:flagellar assembly peptidoglycan hydrolase FlgJ [Marinobacter nanhaiticus D15-8W]|uniref:Peptidoglycan hydrolase FlgJ n=1 Tax=Marinobacter nanhaiticus D15-8W TaxID=626887 RepID=N6WRZ3_9GAMM|nr:flagellar assembly peptidoglycan hydrolase FlgJ [Marinobacter nanhaiticus]ENO13787.1 flagellar assembly peptidoglycan hydrolase FlgJ [Marinobacter nanhaiticus D15-8W]BES71160.1 flagellar assembly peptidoglycan hydrolase FlgJ [Marinobacter nanhaiticus D15-8W]